MLKTAKKLTALLVVLTLCFPVISLADVSWSASDLQTAEDVLASGIKIGNATADTTTFAGTDYANAYKQSVGSNTQVRANPTNYINTLVANNEKITIEFDYRTDVENTYLRCELRNVATSEKSMAAQNPYWTGFQYDTDNKVTKDTWHHFKATVDSKALKESYESSKVTAKDCYFLIQLTTGAGNYWTANFKIRGEDSVLPLKTPGISWYTTRFPLDSEATNYAGVAGDVHKLTLSDFQYTTFQALSTKDYTFVEGKYRLSFWYKEESSNTKKMTRSWRLMTGSSSNADLTNTDGNPYVCLYNGDGTTESAATEWTYVTTDFVVDETTNATLLTGTPVVIKWQSIGATNVTYTSNVTSCGIYISDFEVVKYPDENSKVLSDDSLEVDQTHGSDAEISIGGYIDTSVTPTFKIGETEYTVTLSSSSVPDKKYVTAKYTADTDALRQGGYDGTFTVTDIWGKAHAIPVELVVSGDQTKIIKFRKGTWSDSILNTATETVYSSVSGGTYIRWEDNGKSDSQFTSRIQNLYAEGKSLFKLSFDVSGVSGSTYDKTAEVQLRSGSGTQFTVSIPKEELNDGQPHHYDLIADFGTIDDSLINGNWSIFWRYWGEGTVNYSNISLKYMNETSSGSEVYATLKVKNNVEDAFDFTGSFIVGGYESDVLKTKKITNIIKYVDEGTNRGVGIGSLAKDKARVISIPIDYNENYTYKAFYFSSLDNLTPEMPSVSK